MANAAEINPYKGLRAFAEPDVPFFFGREALSRRLSERLTEKTDLARFLAVVGPSGSGKSSVVKAGLIPAARRQKLPGGLEPLVVEITPGTHPFEELEAGLLRVVAGGSADAPGSLMEQLRDDERGLVRAVKRVIPSGQERSEILLVVDQFEELFTLTRDEAVRADFLDNVFSAVTDPHSRLWVVITLRADFYDRPLLYAPSGELMSRRTELVVPLTPDELYRAITGPAERAGLALEAGLPTTIVQDVGEQPGTLPLLQYALTELYERRDGQLLTLRAYKESGGVQGSLARRAESLYTQLTSAEREEARQLFLRLVTLGETLGMSEAGAAEDTRRRVLLSEVVSAARDEDALRRVLNLFGRYRMLTFDRDAIAQGPTVEIAHEALLRSWGRLRGWLGESRERLLVERRLHTSALEWQAAGQETSFLASGGRLAQFVGLTAEERAEGGVALALTADETAYLRASQEEQERQQTEDQERQSRELALQKRAANRLRYLVVGLVLFLLVAAGLAAWALNRSQVAQVNEQIARTNLDHADALRLGAEAHSLLLSHGDSHLIALLSIHAIQREYSPQADAALSGAALLGFPARRFVGTSSMSGIAISPDGKYLVAANDDTTVHAWDIGSGQTVRVLSGHGDVVLRASFSRDGKYLATAGFDGTARSWDFATGQSIRVFSGHQDWVTSATFSPNGKRLATSSKDGTAYLWDAGTGQSLLSLQGHGDSVWDAVFSPDGRYLLTGSADKSVRLWDVATGRIVRTMLGHTDVVYFVAFSPDGRYLASGGDDKSVRLWDAATGQQLRVFSGHSGPVYGAAFSPDGKYLITGGDATARLWDAATGQSLRIFAGHTNGVFGVAFTPDGRYVASGGFDRTAMLWPVWNPAGETRFVGHTEGVSQARFSADGKKVVTAGDDHIARIWDAETGEELVSLIGHNLRVIGAAFSPDGKWVLTVGGDGTARLWEAGTGKELRQFTSDSLEPSAIFSPDGRHIAITTEDSAVSIYNTNTGNPVTTFRSESPPREFSGLAFSPDGKTLAIAILGVDSTVEIWDPLAGKQLAVFAGHNDFVENVAFSPDGAAVASASRDRTARLWDEQTGKELWRFDGHGGTIRDVTFSPDGKYVLVGGDDRMAHLLDAATGTEVRRLGGHTDVVWSVAFSPNGKFILTASGDKTARVWHTDYHDTIRYLCSLLNRDLTPEERTQHGIADQAPTCPARLSK